MRYGIFSDVHSNLEALTAVLEAFRKESIEEYLCVGDIVGYAADPLACIERVREVAEAAVAGNHDWAAIGLLSDAYFNEFAREALVWTRQRIGLGERAYLEALGLVYKNKDLTLVHGTLEDPPAFDYLIDEADAAASAAALENNICFVGHSHVAGIFAVEPSGRLWRLSGTTSGIGEGNKYIVNVGSVGQPRDGDPRASYCVYDSARKKVWLKRAAYDVASARRRVIAEGLPAYLGDRLLYGQ